MPTPLIKVLFLVLDLDLGGMQRVVQSLALGLDRTRFHPYVYCLDRAGIFADRLQDVGIETSVLQRRPGPLDFDLLRRLYRLISHEKPNVIHSHNSCGFYGGVAGRLAGVPVLVHTDHGRLIPDRKTSIWEDRLVSNLYDSWVAVSEPLMEYLHKRMKIPRKRLRTILNGVDTAQFTPKAPAEKSFLRRQHGLNDNDLVIGTVCRFDPIKNISFLIDCMPSIVRQIPCAKLVIVGEGPCRATFESQVRTLGLSNNVQIWQIQRAVEDIMPIFDLYACSSLSEGTSMTILEAMACGLPIIASAVGGNPNLIGASQGTLFELNHRESFTGKAIFMLNNRDRLEQMGHNGRRHVEMNQNLRQMVTSYQSLYESRLASSKVRRGSVENVMNRFSRAFRGLF